MITLEEAIKELRDASDSEVRYGDTEYHYDKVMKRVEAFEMAIKALEQQPSEDCVARSEALDILDDFEEDVENGKFKTAYAKARERMCELPPVTPSYNSIKTELKTNEDCISREILDKIKAEIDKEQYYFMATEDYDEGIRFGLMLAYQIIDKYIIESEDEDEEM